MSPSIAQQTSPIKVPARRRLSITRALVLFLFLIGELIVFNVLLPGYMSPDSLLDTSRTFVETGILALGMTFVIISGGIDLSGRLAAGAGVRSDRTELPSWTAAARRHAARPCHGHCGWLVERCHGGLSRVASICGHTCHDGDLPRRRLRDLKCGGGFRLSALVYHHRTILHRGRRGADAAPDSSRDRYRTLAACSVAPVSAVASTASGPTNSRRASPGYRWSGQDLPSTHSWARS